MKIKVNRRPRSNEYGPFYKGYIDKVKTNDFFKALEDGKYFAIEFLGKVPADKWDYRYAAGKWSVKEVVQHLIDGERVFAYRALRIARNDGTPLPGFDENQFARNCHAENRTPESLIEEYGIVRDATLQLFRHFTDEDLNRIGTASNHPASPLAIAFIIAGHEKHHLEIVRDRYLHSEVLHA